MDKQLSFDDFNDAEEAKKETQAENSKYRLMDTRCCICNKSLKDAVSVEIGIGPLCRKKYGHAEVNDADRDFINALTSECALHAVKGEIDEIFTTAEEIYKRGYETLANKIILNFVEIQCIQEKDTFILKVPFNREFNDALYMKWALFEDSRPQWVKKEKHRTMSNTPKNRGLIFDLLKKCFDGKKGWSNHKGVFAI